MHFTQTVYFFIKTKQFYNKLDELYEFNDFNLVYYYAKDHDGLYVLRC